MSNGPSPPPSIAALIGADTEVTMGPGSDEDQAALLTYLKAQYADSSTPGGDLSALPTTAYRPDSMPTDQPNVGPSSHDYTHYSMRAPSPSDNSIPIPPSLAELAERAAQTINIPAIPSEYDQSQTIAQFEDRGEMGGKRRKQPHERAGWKEMEQEPRTKKRRGGKQVDNSVYSRAGNNEGQMGEMGYLTHHNPSPPTQGMTDQAGHGNGSGMVEGGASLGAVEADVKQGEQQEQGEAIDPTLDPKESRAAQNRRAQQVFRRRREEHMKKLEADSAALVEVRHHLSLATSKLRETALNLESEHIEKLALQVALRNLSQLGVSILHDDASLITQIGVQPRQGTQPNTTTEVEQAFRTLEAQSRALAKQQRNKREQQLPQQ